VVVAWYARSRREGFIVVAVLWILGALATLASIYATYVANTAAGLSVSKDRVTAEGAVSAALELTAYRLLTVAEDVRPTHGAFSFRLGDANVAVAYRSEAARVDLNLAPKEMLAGLFTALGARASDAQYYAERIIGWRNPGNGQAQDNEAAAYRTAGLTYYPRQAPFASAEELSLVLGLPSALVERAMPYVTVFSGRPDINILDAEPTVIASLPGITPERLHAVLDERRARAQDGRQAIGWLGSQSVATTEGSRAMRVTVSVAFAKGWQVGAEAVILLIGDVTGEEPYRVLFWHDDFDGPA
jgi:general secretion pathway protein K